MLRKQKPSISSFSNLCLWFYFTTI